VQNGSQDSGGYKEIAYLCHVDKMSARKPSVFSPYYKDNWCTLHETERLSSQSLT